MAGKLCIGAGLFLGGLGALLTLVMVGVIGGFSGIVTALAFAPAVYFLAPFYMLWNYGTVNLLVFNWGGVALVMLGGKLLEGEAH